MIRQGKEHDMALAKIHITSAEMAAGGKNEN